MLVDQVLKLCLVIHNFLESASQKLYHIHDYKSDHPDKPDWWHHPHI